MRRLSLVGLCSLWLWAAVSLYLSVVAYTTERTLERAEGLVKRGDYDLAEQALERLALFPTSAELAWSQGNVLRLKGLFRQDEAALKAAVAHHTRATHLNPLDARLPLDLAWTLLQVNDTKGAEKAARAGLTLDPNNAYALYTLGRVQEQTGLYEEAAATYRQAQAARRDPQVAARLRTLLAP